MKNATTCKMMYTNATILVDSGGSKPAQKLEMLLATVRGCRKMHMQLLQLGKAQLEYVLTLTTNGFQGFCPTVVV